MQIDRKWFARNLGAGALQWLGGAIALLVFGWLVALWVSYGPSHAAMTRWDWVYISSFAALSLLALVWGLLAVIPKARALWRELRGMAPPAPAPPQQDQPANLLVDSLCRLAHLQKWRTEYSKHLNKTMELQNEIEGILSDPGLSPDAPALWEKWQRLQSEWINTLKAAGYAYQQAFGVDKDLALSMKWNVGQTPMEGEDEMHPSAVAAKRNYYDQKDHFYRKTPGMNRRFATSVQEANEIVLAHGRHLMLKDLR